MTYHILNGVDGIRYDKPCAGRIGFVARCRVYDQDEVITVEFAATQGAVWRDTKTGLRPAVEVETELEAALWLAKRNDEIGEAIQ